METETINFSGALNREIPSHMQALVLTSPGQFSVEEVSVPSIGPGEVLCKVRAVAICGSDPEIVRGDLAGYWPPSYPFIPGHEWAGEIVEIGEGVTSLKPGDRVAGQAHSGCGTCSKCLEGRYNLCENYAVHGTAHRHYGFVNQGAYAQYNAYFAKSLSKLPSGVTFKEGALVDTAGVVAHGMDLTGITVGGVVAVIGPGPIGLIAARMAKTRGASRVIVVGRGVRLAKSGQFGADVAVDFQQVDPVATVREATGGLGVDQAFECSGARGTFRQAVEMVKRGGAVGLLGVPQGEVDEELPFRYVVSNEIAIFGSKANPNVSSKIISLIATNQLVVRDLVTHVFPLTEFRAALLTFLERRGGAMKVVVEPNGSETDDAL